MGGIIDDFMSVLGNDVSNQASSKLGIGQDTIKQMIPQIAPLILGGLKKQKDVLLISIFLDLGIMVL